MAAGTFADKPCIHTSDYDIYYNLMGEDEEAFIHVFVPVKKVFLGYKIYEEGRNYHNLYRDDDFVGILHSLKGENCYYNIYVSYESIYPVNIRFFDKVTVNGKEYDVELNSYFVTEDLPQSIIIGETEITVGDVEEHK